MGSAKMSDVTIVVNSHNRPNALGVLLKSISDANTGIPVLLVDSSNERVRSQIHKHIKLHDGKIALEILELPEPTSPDLKIATAADAIRTEFFQMYADDDAVFPESVEARVDFLKANPQYSCCLGRQLYGQFNDKLSAQFWYGGLSLLCR